jgi:hypothetical protein
LAVNGAVVRRQARIHRQMTLIDGLKRVRL